jgi:hypothetical protein
MLCCAVLGCTTQCCFMQYYIMPRSCADMLCCNVLCCDMHCCAILCYIMRDLLCCCGALCCVVLWCGVYYTILYRADPCRAWSCLVAPCRDPPPVATYALPSHALLPGERVSAACYLLNQQIILTAVIHRDCFLLAASVDHCQDWNFYMLRLHFCPVSVKISSVAHVVECRSNVEHCPGVSIHSSIMPRLKHPSIPVK